MFRTLAAVGLLAAAPADTPSGLPAGWAGDIGAPVAWQDSTIYLYGDTIQPGNFVQGTTVLTADGPISNAIPRADNGDTFYWPGDGYEMPDGRLFVVLDETRAVGEGVFGFEGVDADGFIVDDPTNPAAWRWADKVEEGPWGADAVAFVDGHNLAVTHNHTDGSAIWQFDPAAPWEPWSFAGDSFPDSHGPFVPVQDADGWWWGVSWAIWGTMSEHTVAALWKAPPDQGAGPYEWVRTLDVEGQTYDHHLNLVDGEIVWRYSTLNGRVTYTIT